MLIVKSKMGSRLLKNNIKTLNIARLYNLYSIDNNWYRFGFHQ